MQVSKIPFIGWFSFATDEPQIHLFRAEKSYTAVFLISGG